MRKLGTMEGEEQKLPYVYAAEDSKQNKQGPRLYVEQTGQKALSSYSWAQALWKRRLWLRS